MSEPDQTQIKVARPAPKRPRKVRFERGEWHEVFLAALRTTGLASVAARIARISRKTAYQHRAADPAFKDAWDDAKLEAAEALAAICLERAKSYSDKLGMFFLRAWQPEIYRENYHVREVSPGALSHDDGRLILTDPIASELALQLTERVFLLREQASA